MKLLLPVLMILLISCGNTYYIVRHAEKMPASASMMSSDVPLTEQGKERAEALAEVLKNKKIRYVFSTNFIRTKSTAQPTAEYFNLHTEIYEPAPDTNFISKLKSLRKNVLIVGHSNTVDDIVNELCGKIEIPKDLPENEFDNLFVVKRKGKRYFFKSEKYGKPSK